MTRKQQSNSGPMRRAMQAWTDALPANLPAEPPAIVHQRHVQERSEKIYEDLCNDKYECPICFDEIAAGGQLYSCHSCHHVYHHGCITSWAKTEGIPNWKCPTCKADARNFRPEQIARCWCGKSRWGTSDLVGNTCGVLCGKYNTCRFKGEKGTCRSMCDKICHPGPCKPTSCCGVACPNRTALNAEKERAKYGSVSSPPLPVVPPPVWNPQPLSDYYNPYFGAAAGGISRQLAARRPSPPPIAPPTAWLRFVARYKALNEGEITSVISWISVVAAVIIAIYLHCQRRVKWWIHPLEYKYFTVHRQRADITGGIVLFFFWVFILPLLLIPASAKLENTILKLFNVKPKSWQRRMLKIFIFLAALATFVAPGAKILTLRRNAWRNEMENSCEGFDTRVRLGASFGKEENHIRDLPVTQFTPYRLDVYHSDHREEMFSLSRIIDTGVSESSPFHYFHRLTEDVVDSFNPGLHMVVDFDLNYTFWRILAIESVDSSSARETLPWDYVDVHPNPTTLSYNETLLRKGTWTPTTKENPHARFPELELEIPEFYFFDKNCHYEPFMRVYRTQNMTDAQVRKLDHSNWTPHSEENLVIRTASFGHGIQRLDACVKRENYSSGAEQPEQYKMQGMGGDMFVPLGLMAILRRQRYDNGQYTGNCRW